MVGILLPTRGRLTSLERCLKSIEYQEYEEEIELVIAVDDDPKTSLYLSNLSNITNSFSKFKIIESKKRLYSVAAFNHALENCESDVFIWLSNVTWFIDPLCVEDLVSEFYEKFSDENGVMSLKNNSGAAFGISSKKFVEYNDGQWFFPGYKVHYCDVELTHRAILLGKYSWSGLDYIFHDKATREALPEIDLATKYELKMKDKAKYSDRKKNKFYLPFNRIVFDHDCSEFVEVII